MRILAAVIAIALAAALSAQTPAGVTATGYLTDTMCGAKGATSRHIECAKRNVASGKAQYAIYDEASRRLYILDTSNAAARLQIESFLGQRVKITGTVSSTPITRAGQSLVPDTEEGAAPSSADNSGAASSAPTDSGSLSSAPTTNAGMRVVTRAKALDTSTPVAGVLSISSIEPAPR